VCFSPSLLKSTTGLPVVPAPEAASTTCFLTLKPEVVLALNLLPASSQDSGGHSQRWHPPVHFSTL